MENKNTGFNEEKEKQEQDGTEWVFGSSSNIITTSKDFIDNIKIYLPKGERQNIGEDKMDCTSRGLINISEANFNYRVEKEVFSREGIQWLYDNGYINDDGKVMFSDAFIAILSGTTRQGNSIKAPLHTIHKHGLIPKSMLPQIPGFDDYYNPERITQEMKNLGKEFKKRFPINYEKVFAEDYTNMIKGTLLNTAGHAWSIPVDGIYPPTEARFNHVFVIIPPIQYEAFDNYIDSVDGDFIKHLSKNYKLLKYSYRIVIGENNILDEYEYEDDLITKFWRFFSSFFNTFGARSPA